MLISSLYPIIQAPMAGNILPAKMVAKIANSGFIANIASGYLSIEQLVQQIIEVKGYLHDPRSLFGVNVFIMNSIDPVILKKSEEIKKLEQLLGISASENFSVSLPTEEEYVRAIISHRVPIASATFGFFNPSSVQMLKANNVIVIGTATSLQEFEYCATLGADAVVLQGKQAGGHQASFLSIEQNSFSTLDLLKQVVSINQKKVPLVASGGISQYNMNDFFHHGASYVQLGTAFMMIKESNISELCTNFIHNKKNTVVTKTITGRYARAINNHLVSSFANEQLDYNFPFRHYETSDIRAWAKNHNCPEYMSLWAGDNPDNFLVQDIDVLIDSLKNHIIAVF
jgi:nitronate monooxygenase